MSESNITVFNGGFPAPRVSAALIEALLASLTYETHLVKGTTTMVATSILPNGYVVATGTAACVSPENFNPALGIEYAITKCRDASREKLWELEGYRLKVELKTDSRKAAVKAISEIRSTLDSEGGRTLADLLADQIADLDQSVQIEANGNAKRVGEMIATYTDAECLGLLLAVLQSRRLGFNAPVTVEPGN